MRTPTVLRNQKDLIDAVNENIRNISLVLLALAVMLTFISFALINNTIRLAIYSKRFLIHTMKLVGASWGFIRRPFLKRNIWSGVLAAFIADTILMGAAYWKSCSWYRAQYWCSEWSSLSCVLIFLLINI